jgi:uncharacterized membrane protein YqjE
VREHGFRAALAEHVSAYGDLLSASSRLWSEQLVRRALGFAVAAIFGLFALLILVFIAILASWPTPQRWWVVGGILLLFAVGILWGLVTAQQALRKRSAPPWTVLAEELATDLRGRPHEPAASKARDGLHDD